MDIEWGTVRVGAVEEVIDQMDTVAEFVFAHSYRDSWREQHDRQE